MQHINISQNDWPFHPQFFKMVLVPIFSHNKLVWKSMVTKNIFGDKFMVFVKNMRLIIQLFGAKITQKLQFLATESL